VAICTKLRLGFCATYTTQQSFLAIFGTLFKLCPFFARFSIIFAIFVVFNFFGKSVFFYQSSIDFAVVLLYN
jgi:hypothetical protein